MITKNQILDAQNKWGNGIVKIGALKDISKSLPRRQYLWSRFIPKG